MSIQAPRAAGQTRRRLQEHLSGGVTQKWKMRGGEEIGPTFKGKDWKRQDPSLGREGNFNISARRRKRGRKRKGKIVQRGWGG